MSAGAGEGARVAVVTGGSAGIGLAICEQLLADGIEVVSLARRPCPLEHPKLHSVECDLLDRAATGAAAQRIADRFAVTTVVHNAGVIRPALLPEVKLDDLDVLVDLHLGCAIQLVQAALPAMRARRSGRVILLSSRPGRVVNEFPVKIAQPRRIESPEVAQLSVEITEHLRAEIRRHAATAPAAPKAPAQATP